MKYYAVIDTNVIVSSFLKEGSIPDQVVSLALNGPIIPLVNDEIILTARSASNAYLITGNKKHYPIKSFVVTPREMIEIIEKDD